MASSLPVTVKGITNASRAFVEDAVADVIARTTRVRATVAQINAGVTLLPAVPGYAYRLTDWTQIAVGGAAATATAVTILGTRAAAGVTLSSTTVGTLTRSTVVKPDTSGVTVLADGASFTALDAGTAITAAKTGGTLATATNIDFILSYVLEAA